MPAPCFMFATGIESSIPAINGGRTRIDRMEACGHSAQWPTGFELPKEVDFRFLRYGPPLHTTFAGPERCDWDFADQTFASRPDRRFYKDLVCNCRDVLPAQSFWLAVPVVMPGDYEEPAAHRQPEQARRRLRREPHNDVQQASG